MDYNSLKQFAQLHFSQPIQDLPQELPPKDNEVLLQEEITALKEELKFLKEKRAYDYVDDFVEEWFEKNKDDVDIGNVKVGPFEVDLLPDEMEKHIYKKTMRILLTVLGEFINKQN